MKKTLCDLKYMRDHKPIEGALEKLMETTPVEYRDVQMYGMRNAAVPGQDIVKVVETGAYKDGVGMYFADQASLVPYLVAAVKELAARVAVLEAKKGRGSSKKEE